MATRHKLYFLLSFSIVLTLTAMSRTVFINNGRPKQVNGFSCDMGRDVAFEKSFSIFNGDGI